MVTMARPVANWSQIIMDQGSRSAAARCVASIGRISTELERKPHAELQSVPSKRVRRRVYSGWHMRLGLMLRLMWLPKWLDAAICPD